MRRFGIGIGILVSLSFLIGCEKPMQTQSDRQHHGDYGGKLLKKHGRADQDSSVDSTGVPTSDQTVATLNDNQAPNEMQPSEVSVSDTTNTTVADTNVQQSIEQQGGADSYPATGGPRSGGKRTIGSSKPGESFSAVSTE